MEWMEWKVIRTLSMSAQDIMKKDAILLEQLKDHGQPCLHLYEWEKKSATYGYFIRPENYLNIEKVRELDLDLAKRPTGGGIVFHENDLAFSVLIPKNHKAYSENTLENYEYVNKRVLKAIDAFMCSVKPEYNIQLLPTEPEPLDLNCKAFCMAKPTQYDVMLNHKKVGGAAQRRTRFGFLHQGTIHFGCVPKERLEAFLIPGTKVYEAMKANSFSLLGDNFNSDELFLARERMKQHLENIFCFNHQR